MHGKWCRKDSATSDAHCESKRLETRSLAEEEVSQQELEKRTKRNIPEPSQPPSSHPRRPTEPVDLSHCRGRLKTQPRRVSKPRRTYQVIRPRQGRIRRVGHAAYDSEGAIPSRGMQRQSHRSRSRPSARTWRDNR